MSSARYVILMLEQLRFGFMPRQGVSLEGRTEIGRQVMATPCRGYLEAAVMLNTMLRYLSG